MGTSGWNFRKFPHPTYCLQLYSGSVFTSPLEQDRLLAFTSLDILHIVYREATIDDSVRKCKEMFSLTSKCSNQLSNLFSKTFLSFQKLLPTLVHCILFFLIQHTNKNGTIVSNMVHIRVWHHKVFNCRNSLQISTHNIISAGSITVRITIGLKRVGRKCSITVHIGRNGKTLSNTGRPSVWTIN